LKFSFSGKCRKYKKYHDNFDIFDILIFENIFQPWV